MFEKITQINQLGYRIGVLGINYDQNSQHTTPESGVEFNIHKTLWTKLEMRSIYPGVILVLTTYVNFFNFKHPISQKDEEQFQCQIERVLSNVR